jgi:hypothetical protein
MWKTNIKPKLGDQIRVNRGLYYHHGIYENDDIIYQFASPVGSEVSPETAIICTTDLKSFLKDGELEVREYSIEEENKKRKPDEVIEFAKSKLGSNMGGYNIISNNCEHFSNLCVFNESKSNQVDDVLAFLGGLFRNE